MALIVVLAALLWRRRGQVEPVRVPTWLAMTPFGQPATSASVATALLRARTRASPGRPLVHLFAAYDSGNALPALRALGHNVTRIAACSAGPIGYGPAHGSSRAEFIQTLYVLTGTGSCHQNAAKQYHGVSLIWVCLFLGDPRSHRRPFGFPLSTHQNGFIKKRQTPR